VNDWLLLIYAGLDPAVAIGLFAASFLGSFITVALGIGGVRCCWRSWPAPFPPPP